MVSNPGGVGPKFVPAGQGSGTVGGEMSSEPIEPKHDEVRELPVEELLRRARPLPPHEEMVIDDLTSDEGEAFIAALTA